MSTPRESRTTTAFVEDEVVRAERVVAELPAPTRYAVGDEIGGGGMGRVHEAFDDVLQRTVAVKVIREERAQRASATARFVSEARLQARLQHPSIVPVHDLGVDASGTPFFVMPRTPGRTLAKVIQQQARRPDPSPPRGLLEVFVRVCLAVEYAHDQGVLHLDLKPSNVMVGDFGDVYVLDWGGATSSDGGRAVVGSPAYTAPEVAADAGHVSAAADIYALGCVLFEILCFARRADHEHGEPSSVRPGLPPELDVICVRATHADPAARYGTARELAEAVDAFLDGARDDALRRRLSGEHTHAAAELAAALPGDDELDTRRAAMREVGMALALDPANEDALRVMLDLAGSEPTRIPADVHSEVDTAARARVRGIGRFASIIYLSFIATLPLLLWVGVLDGWSLWTFYGCMVIAAGFSYRASRSGNMREATLAMVASCIGVAATADLFGPLFVAPMFAAANCLPFAAILSGRWLHSTYVAGVVTVLAPLGLQALGVWDAGYAFVPEGMVILSNALALHHDRAIVLLVVYNVVAVVSGILGMWAVSAASRRTELKLFTQTWHLRQLAPTSTQ